MTDQTNEATRAEETPARRWYRRPGRRARNLGLFGMGVLAALVALVIYGVVFPGPPPLTSTDVGRSITQALASQTPAPAVSEQVFADIEPSLVLIQTTYSPTASPSAAATGGATNGLGSGVIVDDGGDILTSLHVVAGAATIEVTFSDGTQSAGAVESTQPDEDIAVVRAARLPATIRPATLGNPGSIRIGDQAFAVGSPFGLYASISAGIVSGLDRTFQLPHGGAVLHQLIQFDAAVNPGNSGGPLLNRDGQVIGIVTALINPTGQDVFIGIGLAVPINVAGGAAGLPQY
ncbi:MAG TPA: trypsin-like peptidase domain-containing protein [Candidatus Acidoferrales bacterium]|nr:trypsin-like peptidase domain-containing protein [Candidatus Acidoferrales bacterium]